MVIFGGRGCTLTFDPHRYLIQGTHQLNLKAFEGCVRYLGETDMDTDEVQCIIANLIDKVMGCDQGSWLFCSVGKL